MNSQCKFAKHTNRHLILTQTQKIIVLCLGALLSPKPVTLNNCSFIDFFFFFPCIWLLLHISSAFLPKSSVFQALHTYHKSTALVYMIIFHDYEQMHALHNIIKYSPCLFWLSSTLFYSRDLPKFLVFLRQVTFVLTDVLHLCSKLVCWIPAWFTMFLKWRWCQEN